MKLVLSVIQWIAVAFFSICLLGTGMHYSSLFLIVAIILMLPNDKIREKIKSLNIKTPVVVCLSVVLFFTGVLLASLSDTTNTVPESEKGNSLVDVSKDKEKEETKSMTENKVEKNTAEETAEEKTSADDEKDSTKTEVSTTKKVTTTKKKVVTTQRPTTTERVTTTKASTTAVISTTKATTVATTRAENTTYDYVGPSVYITPNGKRYHNDPECAGPNGYSVSLGTAQGRGFTPCGTCIY